MKKHLLFLIIFLSLLFYPTTLKSPTVMAQMLPCPAASDLNNGLITAGGATTANPISGFSNPKQQCATGVGVIYGQNYNFNSLYNQFFVQANPTGVSKNAVNTPVDGGTLFNSDDILQYDTKQENLIYINGNLRLDQDLKSAANPQGTVYVVFVQGNLEISNNICYGSPDLSSVASAQHIANPSDCPIDSNANNNGVVFIVNGAINIDSTVTMINAMLVSSNSPDSGATPSYTYTICTYFDTSSGCPTTLTSLLPNQSQLIVLGNLISLSSDSDYGINFRRNLILNSQYPAEQVFAQPKYFELLKNMFAAPQFTTTQNTTYSINL